MARLVIDTHAHGGPVREVYRRRSSVSSFISDR